ncbi:MAG: RNase adapter RapZ [Betaproteobacteria bacterium]|nr:RNase adapter RapZ [Pseudomonadota bacterium]NBO12913.1 RNase adapter RapZ [Betaproteobacteria bacterium]NBO43834.1 RNase adapter RapZ [Betaproteobacteria bacterium]NBP10200.1 RNase adapter RapZ [Betaproteobacteria bacterium]NBQ82394.1 RNase adapter RapZ [Betaproteobacteria bacterium]
MRLILVTGLSGSGKSVAIRELEDNGFFCIDNLPSRFLLAVCEALQQEGHQRVAVAIDSRSPASIPALRQVLHTLSNIGIETQTIFLEARDHELLARFSETRRRHPLASGADQEASQGLREAIDKERAMLESVRQGAATLDSTGVHPRQLRRWIRDIAATVEQAITLSLESFAFKHGVPEHADLVFDARCLPNPHYEDQLRALDGRDPAVANYLEASEQGPALVSSIESWLRRWLPEYAQDQRSYLTVAIGCTGGQHRSVWTVEQLGSRLADLGAIIRHRGLGYE